ncbi:5-formyltetrahydrofolate cyclo-ligase [Halioxenophilus sp. WMMB6]|uniref:5-formyltetrahydrofolate cyclo-ligase n=1 Tax=Halioxenophilus sp. WMMB6 TaxID=3073815 RepID=UPI00295E26FF|nr:5-formyltetrahydrofolate cyclo-ligase [Halioxenophilus sp. WMMB6]
MSNPKARWQGRHPKKDELRQSVWSELESSGAAVGSPWSAIPNFVGAQVAAARLAELPEWQAAKVVKTNPDAAQAWVRLLALEQGKRLYTPVPELVRDFPFLLLDPEALQAANIPFTEVMYADGFIKHGKRVSFAEIEPLDFCVVGCVAVTPAGGRTGKGAGFADLELGLFRHYGVVSDSTPIATTVHDIQVVDNELVVMQEHDTPLDYIATPERLLATHTHYATPGPMDWSALQPDQYLNIPFLADLRAELVGG